MKDNLLIQTAALPNAANTVNTNTIALPQQSVRPFNTDFRVRLYNTIATGANSKNVNISIYGSNEANGANATLIQTFRVAGNAANVAASEREVYLPPEADKKYIFASAVGEVNGGNSADGTFGLEIIV